MDKEWRIIELAPMLTFEKEPKWIVSRRKLTDAEVATLQLTHFHYNFSDELGLSGDSCLIIGVVTMPGATKAEVENECFKLNNGKKLFEGWFPETEAENVDG